MNSIIKLDSNKNIFIAILHKSSELSIQFDNKDQMYKVHEGGIILHSSPFLEGSLLWILKHY